MRFVAHVPLLGPYFLKMSLYRPIDADHFGNAQGYKRIPELECCEP